MCYTLFKNNSYLAVSNSKLKFMNTSNYFAPGHIFRQYLSTYGFEISTGVFPQYIYICIIIYIHLHSALNNVM